MKKDRYSVDESSPSFDILKIAIGAFIGVLAALLAHDYITLRLVAHALDGVGSKVTKLPDIKFPEVKLPELRTARDVEPVLKPSPVPQRQGEIEWSNRPGSKIIIED